MESGRCAAIEKMLMNKGGSRPDRANQKSATHSAVRAAPIHPSVDFFLRAPLLGLGTVRPLSCFLLFEICCSVRVAMRMSSMQYIGDKTLNFCFVQKQGNAVVSCSRGKIFTVIRP